MSDHHWETYAGEWIDWVRAPRHDAFWFYLEELRTFLPAPGRATLDLGCGEGRLSRELTALGHTVTATDLAPSLLDAARDAGSATEYRLADAADLPFPDAAFDRVVAYNMLMDVPDVDAVVAEAARVLAPDGVLAVSVVHPFSDRGRFSGPDADATFVVDGSYYGERPFDGTETRDGHTMHFAGWSRTLADYLDAIGRAGLGITAVREPWPAPDAPPAFDRWRRMPLFLWLAARPLPR